MTDLENTGATAPADDLRSEIESAFKADADTAALPAAAPSTPVVETPDTEQTAGEIERARDEKGRFTAKQAEEAAKVADAVKLNTPATLDKQAPIDPAAAVAKPIGPPPGWSPTSKAEFDKLPQAVKNDIAKREEEISQGFAKLTEYKGLDNYVEMARGNGTTLPEALDRYVAAENLLESQPVNGLIWLCQKYNVHPAQLLDAIGQGDGHQQPQQDPFAPVFSHIQTLDQRLNQFEAQQQQAQDQAINGEISGFSADPQHKYFHNVRNEMGKMMELAIHRGEVITMKDAYDKACWANPEIRSLLINDQIAAKDAEAKRKADEARRAAGSLSPGSPIAGGTLSSGEPASTLRGEIERAFESSRV